MAAILKAHSVFSIVVKYNISSKIVGGKILTVYLCNMLLWVIK